MGDGGKNRFVVVHEKKNGQLELRGLIRHDVHKMFDAHK
jgi:hypothetical protein